MANERSWESREGRGRRGAREVTAGIKGDARWRGAGGAREAAVGGRRRRHCGEARAWQLHGQEEGRVPRLALR
jgi:hypothetical protein